MYPTRIRVGRRRLSIPSLSNDSCFHAPEEEIELIERNPETLGEAHELPFDGEIFLTGESLRERADCTQAFQVSQNVAIKYRQPTVPAHVSEKVCRFFVPQSLDVLHKPFPELEGGNVRCDRSEHERELLFELHEMIRLCPVKSYVGAATAKDWFRIDGELVKGEFPQFVNDFPGVLGARLRCQQTVHKFIEVLRWLHAAKFFETSSDGFPP